MFVAGEGGVDDGLLLLLHREDFLLDRAARDEFDAVHAPGLADAVRAVGGLVLDGGVPPGVEVNDHVGAGEVQPGAAGLEADQEKRDRPVRVEFAHGGKTILGRAVDVAVHPLAALELGAQDREHRGELAEHEHAVTAVEPRREVRKRDPSWQTETRFSGPAASAGRGDSTSAAGGGGS